MAIDSALLAVLAGFGGTCVGAYITYAATVRAARINNKSATRIMVINTAIEAGIAEFRAVLDANMQGKAAVIPPPLDYYIHCSIVHHCYLHGIDAPSLKEIDEALEHRNSFKNEYCKKHEKEWGEKR